jgi:hypothetical protein
MRLTARGRLRPRRREVCRKTSLDKQPWKDLPEHTGVVESIFIRPAYLGESIAPFRVLSEPEAVIPYDGTALMDGASDRIDRYQGLADWPWHGLQIREGGICFAPPETARSSKGRRFEPAEGLLDVEVDAEEQERPKGDGQQR